jgi:hypothetical protein
VSLAPDPRYLVVVGLKDSAGRHVNNHAKCLNRQVICIPAVAHFRCKLWHAECQSDDPRVKTDVYETQDRDDAIDILFAVALSSHISALLDHNVILSQARGSGHFSINCDSKAGSEGSG